MTSTKFYKSLILVSAVAFIVYKLFFNEPIAARFEKNLSAETINNRINNFYKLKANKPENVFAELVCGKIDHTNLPYISGWEYDKKCQVKLHTTFFLRPFSCLSLELLNEGIADYESLKKIRIKAGLQYLKFDSVRMNDDNNYQVRFCSERLDDNNYYLISIAWQRMNSDNYLKDTYHLLKIKAE